MESLQQHIEHLGLALKAQFFAHPSWAYLIIILVFIIYLVGIICNKDWAVRPAGHYSGWHMIEDFLGRTGLRILSGLLILLAIVLLSYPISSSEAPYSNEFIQVSLLQCSMIRPQYPYRISSQFGGISEDHTRISSPT